MTVICLLHPGAMGASLGGALVDAGHTVRWVSEGRSDATRSRAEATGLHETSDLGAATDGADVVISVCPPGRALDVATAVAATGFGGLYADVNAVAPATMRQVAEVALRGGSSPVDGGIVGPPAHRPGTTRLFLSGDRAGEVAELFDGSPLETVVVEGAIGAASATKVAYAAWTKGSSALLLAVAAFAQAEGVTETLRTEWARSQPDLADRLALVAAGTGPKAWRFADELADSGRAFADAGLPDGFGAGASEIYERLAPLRDRTDLTVDDVLALLLDPGV